MTSLDVRRSGLCYPLAYWRTASGAEVDFVMGDGDVVVEVKSSALVNDRHLRGLKAFKEEHEIRRSIIVSLDPEPRRAGDGIDVMPWRLFLDQLWQGNLMGGPDVRSNE